MMEASTEKYVFGRLREADILMRRFTERDGKILPHRQLYLRLKQHASNHLDGTAGERFLIMPGLRGVGKTTLLWQTYRYLREERSVPVDRLFYLPVDDMQSFLGRTLAEVLQTYARAVHQTSITELEKKIFVFIDEAHFDPNWSKTLKAVYDKNPNIFIVATGSAALSLTMDTDTARRAFTLHAFPLNFSEYLILKYSTYPEAGTRQRIRRDILTGSDENIQDLNTVTTKLQLRIRGTPDIIFENYVYGGGLAFGIFETHVLDKCADVIDRIIRKDLATIRPITRDTLNLAGRILQFLALQKPGSVSQSRLASSLGTSPAQVNNLLDAFGKAQAIFPVLPYAGAGKTVRKAWKYYFMTPTLMASLLYRLGHLDKTDRERYGVLVEHLVASYLYRMQITVNRPQGIFYDPQEGGANFLLQDRGRIIPLEVTIGGKGADQVKRSMREFNSPFGILLSSQENVRKENDVIHMPLWVFAFL